MINKPVEVLIEKDDGMMKIGEKRNVLLKKAKGKYVSFIDDDDLVAIDYVDRILEAIKTNPDCVGITGVVVGGTYSGWIFRHSITVSHWCKDKNAKIFYRTPNHLNPIRRELCISCGGFPEINYGEDHEFSKRVSRFLASEIYVEPVIYQYIKGY